jgi:hypothetical protein
VGFLAGRALTDYETRSIAVMSLLECVCFMALFILLFNG